MKTKLPKPMVAYDSFEVGDDRPITINGEEVEDEEQQEIIHDWVFQGLDALENCPFCANPLLQANYGKERRDSSGEAHAGMDGYLLTCDNCAYWQHFWHEFSAGDFPGGAFVEATGFISKLREFDEQLPELVKEELAQAIRQKPYLLNSIDPYKLERFVADVFRVNFQHCEVTHIGRPFDGGVDVTFVDSGLTQWLIQVKRRANPKTSESVATVRNLLGAMTLNGALKGVVVSTADHFTYRAYEAVGKAREQGLLVELIDRGKLNRMLDPLLPVKPWWPVIKGNLSEGLGRIFARKIVESRKCAKKRE